MAREVQPCGTEAAYRRHLRHNEEPCGECMAAHRALKAESTRARRAAAAEAAQDARPSPTGFDQLSILEEVLSNLRGQLVEAPPQSVAAIAKQIRDTATEIAQLSGESKPRAQEGGGVNDIAARRAEREARRRAASQS